MKREDLGMGFFQIKAIIDAYKEGNLDQFLAEYDENDLALLKNEVQGYSQKHNRQEDLQGLMLTIDNILQEKLGQT